MCEQPNVKSETNNMLISAMCDRHQLFSAAGEDKVEK